ncbi:MAG: hypothetical protein ACLP5H_32190 [Desulfomonilaceae bacterium]
MLSECFQRLVETMQMMVQVEKTVADFYKACAESFPHSHGFWVHLAEEEYRHAEAIDRLAKAAAAKPEDFEPGKVAGRSSANLHHKSDFISCGTEKRQTHGSECPACGLPHREHLCRAQIHRDHQNNKCEILA